MLSPQVYLLGVGLSTLVISFYTARVAEKRIKKWGFDKSGEVLGIVFIVAWVYFLLGLFLSPMIRALY